MARSSSRMVALVLLTSVALWGTAAPGITSAGSRSGQGKLEIVFVKASGTRDGIGRFELGTEKRVRCRYLRPRKDRSLRWSFDDGGDGDFDLVGRFACIESRLLFLLRGRSTHRKYESIRTRRPSRRSLAVRFSLELKELRAKHLLAVAKSRDSQSPACATSCKDRAPDSGFLHVY